MSDTEIKQMLNYNSLVIAGGAMKVLSVIGVFQYLEEKNILKNIHNFVGTSAGALMCLLISLGYNATEIKNIVVESLQNEKITNLNADGLLDILSTYGISDGADLEELYDQLIYKKFKKRKLTFIEFAKITGNNLVICVSNLSKERSEYMCVNNTPDISVAKAVKISCSIPILYTPTTLNDDLYVDGGVYNNFPIDYFKDHSLKDILGINIITKNYQRNESFMEYIQFIMNSIINKLNHKSNILYNCNDKNIITLEFEDNDGWFNISEIKISIPLNILEKYIKMGYDECKNKLS
jgi:predicted acylesterase/phospholipase RssA